MDPLSLGEWGQALFATWWGAHLLTFRVFGKYDDLYTGLSALAPQWAWGVLFVAIGTGIIAASVSASLVWRRVAMTAHSATMITMWTSFMRVDVAMTSTPTYGSWTVLALGLLLLLVLRRE